MILRVHGLAVTPAGTPTPQVRPPLAWEGGADSWTDGLHGAGPGGHMPPPTVCRPQHQRQKENPRSEEGTPRGLRGLFCSLTEDRFSGA